MPARPTRAKPFTVGVADDVLHDLRARLARTRWPEPLPGAGWAYGVDREYLQDLVRYWEGSFDWRERERWLNTFPQFTAEIDGQTVHFVHQRGRGPRALPLVLTHGWPSCYVELLKLVPLLTDPAAHGGGLSVYGNHGITHRGLAGGAYAVQNPSGSAQDRRVARRAGLANAEHYKRQRSIRPRANGVRGAFCSPGDVLRGIERDYGALPRWPRGVPQVGPVAHR